MLKDTIKCISEQYLSEAKNSPQLFADMAAMEKYMAESYCGRVFVEMLQNADDCGSTKIIVSQINNNILFANNGKCFDESDVISICRSGASSKERGASIGYRGVGFKSTTYLSKNILIFSEDTYFTFSKDECATKLGVNNNSVPTVRIPFLTDDIEKSISDCIAKLKEQGFSTVFVFRDCTINSLDEELNEVHSGHFLYLHNITECSINTKKVQKKFNMQREKKSKYTLSTITGEQFEQWVVVGENTSIAFQYLNNEIIPCPASSAMYHCYLPSIDKCPYPIKINSDFSTDPSRKHIVLDDITKTAIDEIASLISEIVIGCLNGVYPSVFKNILPLFEKTISFSQINLALCGLVNNKVQNANITIENGDIIPITQYKLLPSWLETSEKSILRSSSRFVQQASLKTSIYQNFDGVDDFIGKYSKLKYSLDECIAILSDKQCVEQIPTSTRLKMFSNIIKEAKVEDEIKHIFHNIEHIIVYDDYSSKTLREFKGKNLPKSVFEGIKHYLSLSEIKWLENNLNISIDCGITESIKLTSLMEIKPIQAEQTETKKISVSRWRSAEQKCVAIEQQLGNYAVDVSKKNIGYDVESTTPDGIKRYIEVKYLQDVSSSFCITNNEYTSAHYYGDNYFICLIISNESVNKAIYINNPIKTLMFEKRIRQWEWVCEYYEGEELSFENI